MSRAMTDGLEIRSGVLTLAELAARTGGTVAELAAVMRDFERRGIAEETPAGWRLTEYGLDRFGRPLVGLRPTSRIVEVAA